jgi:hypothetical protein
MLKTPKKLSEKKTTCLSSSIFVPTNQRSTHFMKNKHLLTLVIALVISISQSFAQGNCFLDPNTGEYITPTGAPCSNTILTAVPFLRITPDARSGAMGDVGLAISPDANAMNFNASKLAFSPDKFGASITYTPWLRALGLNDVYLANLTGYGKLGKRQALGLGLRFFSLGLIQFTNENGDPQGQFSPRELELSTAYARKLSDNFSASIGLKYIYSNLAGDATVDGTPIYPAHAVAGDLGISVRKPFKSASGQKNNWALGAAISNLGTKINYTRDDKAKADYLPANLGIGGAVDLNFDEHNSVSIALDVNKLLVPTPQYRDTIDGDNNGEYDFDNNGNSIPDFKEYALVESVFKSFGDAPDGFSEELKELMYSVGVEYWYDKMFAVRAGYYSEARTKGNRRYLTLGLGVKYSFAGLNFSYLVPTSSQRNPLDNTLRFSLIFDINELGKEIKDANTDPIMDGGVEEE